MGAFFDVRLLPSQIFTKEYFSEDDFIGPLCELVGRFSNLRSFSEALDLEASPQIGTEVLASSPVFLKFLELLISIKRPKRVLEIGTFIGVSGIFIAKALPEGSELVTIEKYDHFAQIARNNFRRNGVADRVRLIEGDALEEVAKLPQSEPFDLIFLDGNKEHYVEYFKILDRVLAPGGLFIVDDVFFMGDVLNEHPKSEKGKGVKNFLEYVEHLDSYSKVIIPMSNGTMLMVKR